MPEKDRMVPATAACTEDKFAFKDTVLQFPWPDAAVWLTVNRGLSLNGAISYLTELEAEAFS
jgi:hypothetical protein